MRRKDNLYNDICKIENIQDVFKEICINTKNEAKVQRFKNSKCMQISQIKEILENRAYVPGPYNRFIIFEPKERKIVSQSMPDKLVNHLVSRYILMPSLLPCLIDNNIASRKNLGTKRGLILLKEFHRKCKINYGEYYILKCDISKFFASINKPRLKEKLKKRIKDKDALKIVFDIIDSEPEGLGISNMTSQILAIFYLNDLDHYIKEKLKIKYYVRYQDDFILFHKSKEYLKECLEEIRVFLEKEKLVLNKKTRIYNSKNNYIPLLNYCSTLASYNFLRNDFKQKVINSKNKKE